MKRAPGDTRVGLRVQATMCDTCIYKPSTGFDIADLERQVADPHMDGLFRGFRACHHAKGRSVCCRGFWDRHKDHFPGGQIAQRLRRVIFVTIDVWKKP